MMQAHIANLEKPAPPTPDRSDALPSTIIDVDIRSDDASSSSMTTNAKIVVPKKITNFKCVTWNLWCMPVSSPRALSNPDRCASYLSSIAQKQKWSEFDGLIVICLQEVWCWKTGIFPPFLLRLIAYLEYIPYIGHVFSAIFQIISLLLGALPLLKCLPIMYDPKNRIINKMKSITPYSIQYSDIPMSKFLDNGLAMMTNIKPYKTGFETYESTACDDSLANKGFMWCYFNEQKLVILNTHLQAAGSGYERLQQLKQLRRFLNKVPKKLAVEKVIVIGDFNIDMQTHQERMKIYQQQQQQLLIHDSHHNPVDTGNKTVIYDDMEDKPVIIENVNDDHIQQNKNDAMYDKHEINKAVDSISEHPHLLAGFKKYEHELTEEVIQQIHDDINNSGNRTTNDEKSKANTRSRLLRHKKSLSAEDPLTQISYNILPKQMVPLPVRSIFGYKKKYVKKSYINIPYYLGPKFTKINTYQITFKRGKYNIDHIFCDFPVKNIRNESYAQDKKILSDHQLIVSHFALGSPNMLPATPVSMDATNSVDATDSTKNANTILPSSSTQSS